MSVQELLGRKNIADDAGDTTSANKRLSKIHEGFHGGNPMTRKRAVTDLHCIPIPNAQAVAGRD
jgi:hypothetical protein